VSEQIQIERIENQLTRMENSLRTALSSASPPSWIIVVGHYPIFSAGDHGDIDEMKSYLLPLLLKYNVHAYICGHDHISEHLTYSNMSFYVVGAGSMTDSMKRTSSAELVWGLGGVTAFAVVNVDSAKFELSYYTDSLTRVYSHAMYQPTRVPTMIPTQLPRRFSRSPTSPPQATEDNENSSNSLMSFHPSPVQIGFMTASATFIVVLAMLMLRVRSNKRKLLNGGDQGPHHGGYIHKVSKSPRIVYPLPHHGKGANMGGYEGRGGIVFPNRQRATLPILPGTHGYFGISKRVGDIEEGGLSNEQFQLPARSHRHHGMRTQALSPPKSRQSVSPDGQRVRGRVSDPSAGKHRDITTKRKIESRGEDWASAHGDHEDAELELELKKLLSYIKRKKSKSPAGKHRHVEKTTSSHAKVVNSSVTLKDTAPAGAPSPSRNARVSTIPIASAVNVSTVTPSMVQLQSWLQQRTVESHRMHTDTEVVGTRQSPGKKSKQSVHSHNHNHNRASTHG
jgi:hypothetical protein